MSNKGLLPRVRVSYSFLDLICSIFVSEKRNRYRKQCKKVLSNFFYNENICLTPSARDAIYELLVRLPQTKVVIPAYTCIAVNEAVQLAGKEIIFSRSKRKNFNSTYIECIDNNTIVLATHQYGLPCDIENIASKCREIGAVLIEDCATSIGTEVNGKKTGTFGDYAVVSFNASKLLNVPPFGGAIISKNEELLRQIENEADWKPSNFSFKVKGIIRGLAFVLTKNSFFYKIFHYITIQSKGRNQKTVHERPSEHKTDLYNYRFSEWQASILLKQLNRLNHIIFQRKKIYHYYDEHISNPLIKKPILVNDAVCCRYAILVENRNDFYSKCVEKGVDLDFSHCVLGCPLSYTEEQGMAHQVLNLPFNNNLSNEEVKKVVKVINSII